MQETAKSFHSCILLEFAWPIRFLENRCIFMNKQTFQRVKYRSSTSIWLFFFSFSFFLKFGQSSKILTHPSPFCAEGASWEQSPPVSILLPSATSTGAELDPLATEPVESNYAYKLLIYILNISLYSFLVLEYIHPKGSFSRSKINWNCAYRRKDKNVSILPKKRF